MSTQSFNELFADPKRSQNLALGLGVLGSSLVAIGIGVDVSALLIVGCVILASSGVVWAIRGVKEDQANED